MNAIAQSVHGDHRKEIRYAKVGALSGCKNVSSTAFVWVPLVIIC